MRGGREKNKQAKIYTKKAKTQRRTHTNCGLVFKELRNNAEDGWLQPSVTVALVQLEYRVLVHKKLQCEKVFSLLLE